MAQGKKTGGRQKGGLNRKNADRIAKATASGLMPAEVMLLNMRDAMLKAREADVAALPEAIEAMASLPPDKAAAHMLAKLRVGDNYRQFAQACAHDAAPYFHAKLASVEHTGKDGGPIVVELVRFSPDADKTAV